jgi:hypothetical protein
MTGDLFTAEGEILRCLDIALVLAKGCISRKFLRTDPKIVGDLPG